MMKLKMGLKLALLLVAMFTLAGCLEEEDDSYDYDYGSEYDDSGSSGSSSGGGSYDYTYSCPGGYGGGGTVPIPEGGCESQYERYAKTFGCNLVNDFDAAACALENCTGAPFACGAY
jgi:hypothetical protein